MMCLVQDLGNPKVTFDIFKDGGGRGHRISLIAGVEKSLFAGKMIWMV
jgi:hypothetical protein